jgi:hypothetical protein
MTAASGRRASVTALAVALCLVIAACGDDDDGGAVSVGDSDGAEIRHVFKEFEADLQAGRAQDACSRMTQAGQREAAGITGGAGGSCEKTIKGFAQGADELEQKPSRIVSVEVTGGKAVAKVSDAGRAPVDLPFAKEGGEWRLAGLGFGQ